MPVAAYSSCRPAASSLGTTESLSFHQKPTPLPALPLSLRHNGSDGGLLPARNKNLCLSSWVVLFIAMMCRNLSDATTRKGRMQRALHVQRPKSLDRSVMGAVDQENSCSVDNTQFMKPFLHTEQLIFLESVEESEPAQPGAQE